MIVPPIATKILFKTEQGAWGEKARSGVLVSFLLWQGCVTNNPKMQLFRKANTHFSLTGLWVTCASTRSAVLNWTGCLPFQDPGWRSSISLGHALLMLGGTGRKGQGMPHTNAGILSQNIDYLIPAHISWPRQAPLPSSKSVESVNIHCLMRGTKKSPGIGARPVILLQGEWNSWK